VKEEPTNLKRVIISGLMAMALGTSISSCVILTKPIINNPIIMRGEVSSRSVIAPIEELKSQEGRSLVIITSPGGSVNAGRELLVEMRHKDVDTYVPNFAYSMGAEMWLEGKRRYVEPDAVLLFHSALVPSLGSPHELEQMIRVMEQEPIKTKLINGESTKSILDGMTSTEDKMYFLKLVRLSGGNPIDFLTAIQEFKTVVSDLNAVNRSLLTSKVFKKLVDSGKMTMERIKEIVYGDLKGNVFLTGQELYDLGIATDLGRPDKEQYTD
jgi:ATP-dependent protease ClpP protease subunit